MFVFRFSSGLVTAIIYGILSASGTQAQAPSSAPGILPPTTDPRDFQGFWQGPHLSHNFTAGFSASASASGAGANAPAGGAGPPSNGTLPGTLGPAGTLPFKPELAAKLQRDAELVLKGTAVMLWHVACRPTLGQSLLGDDIGGVEVMQTPTRVLFLSDTDNSYWEIYLDRGHPRHVKPSYFGHSIGHWEGTTLVVDTVGYNGRSYITPANINSKQLHTVTRFWKTNGGKQLNYQTSVDDPLNLTEPGTLPVAFENLMPDLMLYEDHCTQSMRPESNADMIYEDFTREEAFPYLYKKGFHQ